MKKFVYLCGMMLLSINMMAQIDIDSNWDNNLMVDFDDPISYWDWHLWDFSNSNYRWKAFLGSTIAPEDLHHVYRPKNAVYDSINGMMRLVCEYDFYDSIPAHKFPIPHNQYYASLELGNKLYFSGAIEYVKRIWFPDEGKFLYGYFEIRCKNPVHKGAFPAFWLHAQDDNINDPYYEEIDIYEYSWSLGDPDAYWLPRPNPNATYPGDPQFTTTGIYHNLHGQSVDVQADSYGRNYPQLSQQADMGCWHTFSCEWMPDHVYWFIDGNLVNSYYDSTHIPRHPLILKTNYSVDDYYRYGGFVWTNTDEMDIDYIRVYQLRTNCNKVDTIASQNDLDDFQYELKKSVYVTSTTEEVRVYSSDTVAFRVVDTFEVTGPFQVDSGASFTVIRQDCPCENDN